MDVIYFCCAELECLMIADIAVNGQWLEIVIAGQVYGFGGTSLSVQVFAAMVSLVNAARKEAGKSVLGFINPAL